MEEISGNKRIILITGDDAKWFDQAIFIVKKNISGSKMPVDFVVEAENIIDNYMSAGNGFINGLHKKKPKVEYAVSNAGSLTLPQIKKTAVNTSPKRRKSGFDFFLNVVMLCSCVALACIVGSMLMK